MLIRKEERLNIMQLVCFTLNKGFILKRFHLVMLGCVSL